MTRIKLVWRLFPAFILIAGICLVAGTWYTASSWQTFYLGDVHPAPDAMQVNEICRKLGKITSTRLTVILASGKVAGDSQEDPQRMDNHADRPEFREAMQGRAGVSTRFSYTLGHNMMYVAVPWRPKDQPGGVVRAALPMKAIEGALKALYVKVAWGGLGVALLAAFLGLFIARRISEPLKDLQRGALRFARGDLDRKVPIPHTDELASLAEALNYMGDQLQAQIQTLSRRRKEQEAILSSMTEGVLALDAGGRLLTINSAGAEMLSIDPATTQSLLVQEVIQDPGLKWFINRTLSNPEPIEGEVEIK